VAEFTDFRNAIRDLVSEASGVSITVNGAVEGPSTESDVVAVFPGGSSANEQNQQFRLRAVTARVILARDAEVGPLDDDPLDVMETIEEDVLAALTPFVTIPTGLVRVVSCDTSFDPGAASIDFVIVGEFDNPNEV